MSISKLSTPHIASAHHSCPAPSDSTGSSSLPEKGQDDRNWSSSVDTRSSSVDTRDSFQKPSGQYGI
ncbi:hypothetical protein Taro_046055, partial [Colocasia esculenta]|nr:hypothetical protein [Colocasia esculenta]